MKAQICELYEFTIILYFNKPYKTLAQTQRSEQCYMQNITNATASLLARFLWPDGQVF